MDVAKKQHAQAIEVKPRPRYVPPTKYKKKYATQEFLSDFLEFCKRKRWHVTIGAFALYIGIPKITLYKWSDKYPGLAISMKSIKELSAQVLISKGLTNKYNANFARFVLSANHGMSEKITTEHAINKETADLLGLIDGESKGQLPSRSAPKKVLSDVTDLLSD